jgi:P pilus assembly chaperone PapD
MATSGGQKLTTLSQVGPGATKNQVWNNATAEVYSLHAWPVVASGATGSAEITATRFVVHGNPSERELHYTIKNTGSTPIDIAVWAFWWNA